MHMQPVAIVSLLPYQYTYRIAGFLCKDFNITFSTLRNIKVR